MAITDYTVVIGSANTVVEAITELRKEVLTGIRRDWEPLGGVSLEAEQLTDGTFRVVAVQAMTKSR